MSRNKAGLGAPGQRIAPTLGVNDPRLRNPGTAETQGELVYALPLEINRQRKVGLRVGRGLRVSNGTLEVDMAWVRQQLGL